MSNGERREPIANKTSQQTNFFGRVIGGGDLPVTIWCHDSKPLVEER